MALTNLKNAVKSLSEAMAKFSFNTKDSIEGMESFASAFGALHPENFDTGTLTVSATTSDGTGEMPYEQNQDTLYVLEDGTVTIPNGLSGDTYEWGNDTVVEGAEGIPGSISILPYRSATMTIPQPYWTSTTLELGDGNVGIGSGMLDLILQSGGSHMELEKLSEISQSVGVGVREILSLFTEFGEKCKVRRDIAEEHYLRAIRPRMENGLFNITKGHHAVLLIKGKYAGVFALPEGKVGSTIKVPVKSASNIMPKVRAIRIPGMKPKVITSTFKSVFKIAVSDCDLVFPVFDTSDNIYYSKDGNYYKED